MKIILSTLLITFFITGYSQRDTSHKCPLGWSWMPSMSTTSLIIDANQCLPDSISKQMYIEFGKNMCGEMGLGIFDGRTSYDRTGTWSDSCGCIWKERWQKLVKNKWVNITKREYEKLNK